MEQRSAQRLFEQAAAIARAGKPADAVRFIEDSAERGDPDANVIVAHWLLYGSDRARDPAAACRHLERAAGEGSAEALRILAHLTASGTGREPDREKAIDLLRQAAVSDPVAAQELTLLPEMMPVDEANRAPRDMVSADPHIEIVRKLLLPQECAYLIRRAEPLLKPSFVDDGRTGIGRPDPIRTSHGAAFVPHESDLVVQAITDRIAAVTGTSSGNAEALYVMRYEPGQQYRPHMDALPGLANQREWTAIAYLNDAFEGGATAFPDLGLSLRLGAGDLLVFRNSDADQRPDMRMRHAGEPVTSGAKWVATRWIRHAPHDPYDRG
jgi:prolyl 4-hydroxylase